MHGNGSDAQIRLISGGTRVDDEFERIAATSPDVIFILDGPGDRLVYCNERISEVLGWTVDEFKGWRLRERQNFIHPDDLTAFSEWVSSALQASGDEIFQTQHRIRHADGSWRWMRVRVAAFRRDAAGRVVQLIGTATDTTEQVLTQETLRRQTGILQLILDSMSEGVIVCDAQGDMLLVNPSAERMLKLNEPLTRLAQVKEAHAREQGTRSGLRVWHQHPLARALDGQSVSNYELSLYDRNRGLSVTLNHSSAPLCDSAGGIIGAVDVFRDVTDSHRALQELQRAEHASAPEALAILAHAPAVFFRAAVGRCLPQLAHRLATRLIFRGEESREAASENLILAKAKDALRARVPADDQPVAIEHEDRIVGRALHQQAEMLLGALQLL